jgi:hypothetical protein
MEQLSGILTTLIAVVCAPNRAVQKPLSCPPARLPSSPLPGRLRDTVHCTSSAHVPALPLVKAVLPPTLPALAWVLTPPFAAPCLVDVPQVGAPTACPRQTTLPQRPAGFWIIAFLGHCALYSQTTGTSPGPSPLSGDFLLPQSRLCLLDDLYLTVAPAHHSGPLSVRP